MTETYLDRIRRNTEKLRQEKDNRKRSILQKQIQRDRISVEIENLKKSYT